MTLAPWEAKSWRDPPAMGATTVVTPDDSLLGYRVIAECDSEENARIMAASRELLEALKALRKVDQTVIGSPEEASYSERYRAACALADSAIEKAEIIPVRCMGCGWTGMPSACHSIQNLAGFYPPVSEMRICPECMLSGPPVPGGLALKYPDGRVERITGIYVFPRPGETMADTLKRSLAPGHAIVYDPTASGEATIHGEP